jgi:DNA-directed RNA polymerase specialized sigma24 family protein
VTETSHVIDTARCAEPGSASREVDSSTFANLFHIYYHLLPELERRVMHLIHVERRSYAEAARILDLGSRAVRQLVFLGRLRIQKAMSPTLPELGRALACADVASRSTSGQH